MKKYIAAIVLCTIFSLSSDSYGFELEYWGNKVGLNITNVAGDFPAYNDESPDSRMSGTIGFYLNYSLFDNVSFQPEMFYSVRGFKHPSLQKKLAYLDFPVLAKYSQPVYGNIAAEFIAGPMVSVFMYDIREPGSTSDTGGQSSFIHPHDFHRFDLQFVVGGGFEIGRVLLEARYSIGLTEFSKDSNLKHQMVSFLVGF